MQEPRFHTVWSVSGSGRQDAKQHSRANKAMRKLRTYLGRTIRDIRR